MQIQNKLFLAPMAGYSDIIFRKLCRRFGAEVTVSEMISVKATVFRQKKTLKLAESDDEDRPYGIQLFGYEPDDFASAASFLYERFKPDFFDINCGCPVRKVIRQKSGSWLLNEPERITKIISAIKKAVPDVFVSAKIRLGFDEKKNFIETSRAVEDGGADFIIVHARTRPQLFKGPSDLEALQKISSILKIPVVGNGGVCDKNTWKEMKDTGIAAVMIGTASIGRPWIFSEISAYRDNKIWQEPSFEEKIKIFIEHIKKICENIKDEERGTRISRCYAMQYIKNILKGFPGVKDFLKKYHTLTNLKELYSFADEILLLYKRNVS